jgi:formamidopyrimidine-DNA glycosylase
MPEAPEIETIRRTHETRLVGQRIASIWRSDLPLRTPTSTLDFQFLVGQRICALSRFAKILIIECEREQGVFMRFGMSGRLFAEPTDSVPPKHTHLRIQLANSDFELRFIDARRFGDVSLFHNAAEREQGLLGLGPDGTAMNEDEIKGIAKRIKQSASEIKVILLNQAMLSGVGNIYACEALFIAKVSPTRRGCDLTLPAIKRVLQASKDVMLKAVANKGTTFMSYLDGNGEKGGNQEHLLVFGREGKPCEKCGKSIKRIVQSGRSTFYCSACQS